MQQQKISKDLLCRMAQAQLTRNEMNILMHIAQFQDSTGYVRGVYYRDVCNVLDISTQGFYDALKGLEKKEIIKCVKSNYYDIDIEIIGNSYAEDSGYKKGYVSLRTPFFRTTEFRSLKAGAQIMCMWLFMEWNISYMEQRKKASANPESYKILKITLLDKFQELLGVSKRMIRSYLGNLKPFLEVYLEKGRKYYLTFKKSVIRQSTSIQTEAEEYRRHAVDVGVRRNRVVVSAAERKELERVLSCQRKKLDKNEKFDFSHVIARTIEVINQNIKKKSKWQRRLNMKLVTKILAEEVTC
ncbi:hypothetical protein M2145_002562 [Lachnospiraceae bacterium PF1-21]